MQISEVMTANPASVASNQTIQQAAQAMIDHDCGSLPVLDRGNVCGVITDRDIAIRAVACGHGPDQSVSEVMTDSMVSVPSTATTKDAATLMADQQVRRLYVVDDGQLVGVVALADLATEAPQEQASKALEGISQ